MVLSMTPMTAFAVEPDVNDGEIVLRSETPDEAEAFEAEKPALGVGTT